MSRSALAFLAGFLLLSPGRAASQPISEAGLSGPGPGSGPARLVADLTPGTAESWQAPSGFAQLAGRAVFLRIDTEYYPALWATDGTVEGTTPLGVLCPPCGYAVLLGATDDLAFYAAYNAWSAGFEVWIWRTDGTPEGTFPVTGSFTIPRPPRIFLSAVGASRLYFTACTPKLGCELWSSDGSPGGTGPVAEIEPGPKSARIRELITVGDRAFLLARTRNRRLALWQADGAAHRLDLLALTPGARRLTTAAGRAYFIARRQGFELWASDGTPAGTSPVTGFAPDDPFPLRYDRWRFPQAVGDRIYFLADDGLHGVETWSAGGLPVAARRVTDFAPPEPFPLTGEVAGPALVRVGPRIAFVADDGGGPRLWTLHGQAATALPVSGCDGGCPRVSAAPGLAALGDDRVLFVDSRWAQIGLWVSDGTGPGTRLLRRSEHPYWNLVQMASTGGRVLAQITQEYERGELWVSDGSPGGTFPLARGGPGWSHYYGWGGRIEAATAGGRMVFSGAPDEEGAERLWATDGTPEGSEPLSDARSGRSSYPGDLTPFAGGLLVRSCNEQDQQSLSFVRDGEVELLAEIPVPCSWFALSTPVDLGSVAVFVLYSQYLPEPDQYDVWRTDGTPQGTYPLTGPEVTYPWRVLAFRGEAVFHAIRAEGDGTFRSVFWTTDGTLAGTHELVALPPEVSISSPDTTTLGDRLYFKTFQPGAGPRIWVSDGTPAGTCPLTDSSSQDVQPRFAALDGRVYFLFAGAGRHREIWVTDGTPGGTVPAVTRATGAGAPIDVRVAGDRLYFAARRSGDRGGPPRPWSSDGTDQGTVALGELTLRQDGFGWQDSFPFVELDGAVYFAAIDPTHGDELWRTDGSAEGTALVADLAPGLLGSYPRELVRWNGRLYFRARDLRHGMELWASDGTAEGTGPVTDLAPGASWSTPRELTPAAGRLYFSAHDGVHGREPWELSPAPP